MLLTAKDYFNRYGGYVRRASDLDSLLTSLACFSSLQVGHHSKRIKQHRLDNISLGDFSWFFSCNGVIREPRESAGRFAWLIIPPLPLPPSSTSRKMRESARSSYRSDLRLTETTRPPFVTGHCISIDILVCVINLSFTAIIYIKWKKGKRAKGERSNRIL